MVYEKSDYFETISYYRVRKGIYSFYNECYTKLFIKEKVGSALCKQTKFLLRFNMLDCLKCYVEEIVCLHINLTMPARLSFESG